MLRGTKNYALTFLEYDIMCLEAQDRFDLKTSHLAHNTKSVDFLWSLSFKVREMADKCMQ